MIDTPNTNIYNYDIICFTQTDTTKKYAQDAKQTIGVPSVNVNYYLNAANTFWYPNNTLIPLYTYMGINLANGTSMYLEVDLSTVIK